MTHSSILINQVVEGLNPREVLEYHLLDENLSKVRKMAADITKSIKDNKITKTDLRKFFSKVQTQTFKLVKSGVKITGKILLGIIKVVGRSIWGATKAMLMYYPVQTISLIGTVGAFLILSVYRMIAGKFDMTFKNVMDPKEYEGLDPDMAVEPA